MYKENSTQLRSPNKAFIFHKDEYFSQALAAAIGYQEEEYSAFQNHDELTVKLEDGPTHIIICEDRVEQLCSLLQSILIKCLALPHVVLFTFGNKDSLIKFLKLKFPEIQECLSKSILQHCQLPTSLDEINRVLTLAPRDTVCQKKAKEIGDKIARRLAEDQDRYQRHKMGNLITAIRILNGAIRSGDYNLFKPQVEERVKGLYKALLDESNEWKSDGEKEKDKRFQDTIEFIEKAKIVLSRGGITSETEIKSWHEEANIKKVLVIDDEKKMWKPVWEFIFGEEKIDIVSTEREAIERLNAGLQYHCALIDIYLGDSEPSGLEVLWRVRKMSLDLPVVMLTAYDDADLTKTSYEHGASFYFVKEREDRGDRDSLRYFIAFKQMILSLKPYSSKERELARRFQAIESPLKALWKESAGDLAKALFFLILDPQERGLWYFTGGSSPYAKAAFYAHRAVEQQVDFELKEKKIKPLHRGRQIEIASLSEKIMHGVNQKIFSQDAQPFLKTNLCRKCGGMAHLKPTKGDSDQQELKEVALGCLNEALDWFEKLGLKNSTQSTSETLPGQSNKPTFPKILPRSTYASKRLGHSQRGLAGANRILWGAYLYLNLCSEIFSDRKSLDQPVNDIITVMEEEGVFLPLPKRSQYGCLFIDDEGETSGWKRCLEVLLPDIGIDYLEYKTATTEREVLNRAEMADFVILDLKLPDPNNSQSEEIGLFLLEKLKEAYPALPVIVLTASDDALTFRRAINRGAIECFPKTNEDYFDIDDKKYFTCYYERFCSIIKRVREYLDRKSVQTYQKIGMLSHDLFWPLNFLKVEGKPYKSTPAAQSLFGREVKSFSDVLLASVREGFLRAFYFASNIFSLTATYWIQRLYVTSGGSLKTGSFQNDAAMAAGETIEFLVKIIAGLYRSQEKLKKVTGGNILKAKGFKGFRSENEQLVNKFKFLWKQRNQAKRGNMGIDGFDYLNRALTFTGDVALRLIELLSEQNRENKVASYTETDPKYTDHLKYFPAQMETEPLQMVMKALYPLFLKNPEEREKVLLKAFQSILVGSALTSRTLMILRSHKNKLENSLDSDMNRYLGEISSAEDNLRNLLAEKSDLLEQKKEVTDHLKSKTTEKQNLEGKLARYYSSGERRPPKVAGEIESKSKQFEVEIKSLEGKIGKVDESIREKDLEIKEQTKVLRALVNKLIQLRKIEAEIRRADRDIAELEWKMKYLLFVPIEEYLRDLERLFERWKSAKIFPNGMKEAQKKIMPLLDFSGHVNLADFFWNLR